MKTIYEELLGIRTARIKAGENPPFSIDLSEDRKARLKEWCDSTVSTIIFPDGHKEKTEGVSYEKWMILGMTYVP